MTPLRRRMLEDLPLRGLAPRTQPCDVEAGTQLTPYDRRAPDQSSAADLRQYCLFLIHAKQVAESPFRIHLDGIRCVYERTRQRPWPVFDRVRPRHPQTRPVVLRLREVRALWARVANPPARMCLQLLSACGLRLREGTQLQVSDIDSPRLLVRVCQGTGGTDRFVPRAPRVLAWWRAYWQRQRPRPWRFPARHQQTPLPAPTLQKTCALVVRQSGMPTEASLQTQRHASATHLWARGVSLRVIQALLGHQRPRTTARDTHLTPPTLDVVHATITALMADL
jgi:integrase/recombinase XerD